MAPSSVAGSVQGDGTAAATTAKLAPIKVAFPDTFNGERKKLKAFFIQVELWLAFNREYFKFDHDKILWTIALFRGSASEWVSTYLVDYMTHRNPDGKVN